MTTEALTESFCERCGTRYEFAAPTELNTMRKTRGLISGLKNYIMSQDALGDAVGDAMRSEEEALASQQLEAFHESFNFCINCRQYTCLNCWNDDAGRCRTCVPVAGTDDLLERFEASFHAQHPEIAAAATQAEMEQADLNRRLGLESWPSADLEHAPANGAEPDWPQAEVPPSEQEPMVAEVEPEPEPTMVDAAIAATATAAVSADEYPPLRVVAWEEDAAIALEPEPIVAAEVVPDEEPEPIVAEAAIAAAIVGDAEDEPEPGVPDPITAATMAAMLAAETSEPEPATAEVEPEPERPAPEPIRPISETIIPMPQPPPQVSDADRVAAVADDASVAARKAQLDLLGIGDPGEGAVADRSNVLPYRSSGASVSAREMAMRTASGLPAPGAFWEASAKEVAGAMSHVGVQACGECGLSLSASARFCRRCGTPQARSA
jgi:ribosomal protein L40E